MPKTTKKKTWTKYLDWVYNQVSDAMLMCEELEASEKQTALIIKLDEIRRDIKKMQDEL